MKNIPFARQIDVSRFFSLLFLLFCAIGQAYSQGNVLVSEPIALRNDYGYELIGRLKDRILLFRDKYDEFEVQAFDNQMRMSWTRKLEDLEKSGIQIPVSYTHLPHTRSA